MAFLVFDQFQLRFSSSDNNVS